MNSAPTEPRPDVVAVLARRLGQAGRAAARFVFETLAGLGLLWALRNVAPVVPERTAARREREEAARLPWSDGTGFPRSLIEFGSLLVALRVAPGDSVVELGSGLTGWRSHFLNLHGCPTVTIDSQPAALDATRTVFRRHPATRWELDPRFVVTDGRRLPLLDEAHGRLVLPAGPPPEAPPAEMLAELFRVTAWGGRVALRWSGERGTKGLEGLAREARRAGFTAVAVLPSCADDYEVPAERLRKFLRGRGLLAFWRSFGGHQLAGSTVVLSKGVFVPTTRRPGGLGGRIEVVPRRVGDEARWLEATRGTTTVLHCEFHNVGETRWLAGTTGRGATRLVLSLGSAQASSQAMVRWHGIDLPQDLAPGEILELDVELPAVTEAGDYRLGLGLEAEGIGPFGHECPVVELRLQVR